MWEIILRAFPSKNFIYFIACSEDFFHKKISLNAVYSQLIFKKFFKKCFF